MKAPNFEYDVYVCLCVCMLVFLLIVFFFLNNYYWGMWTSHGNESFELGFLCSSSPWLLKLDRKWSILSYSVKYGLDLCTLLKFVLSYEAKCGFDYMPHYDVFEDYVWSTLHPHSKFPVLEISIYSPFLHIWE